MQYRISLLGERGQSRVIHDLGCPRRAARLLAQVALVEVPENIVVDMLVHARGCYTCEVKGGGRARVEPVLFAGDVA